MTAENPAHCAGRTDDFMSHDHEIQKIARRLCWQCPVMDDCRALFIHAGYDQPGQDPDGVWFGTTLQDRQNTRMP